MKPRQINNAAEIADIIDFAVRDGALAVVTYWLGDEWRSFKGRFLERDSQRRYFVLDCPDAECGSELLLGQYVGLSFRYKSRKVMLSTVLEARGKFVVDDQTTLAAVRYRWPDVLTELQRRAYYRTPVPCGVSMLTSMWLGGQNSRDTAQTTTFGVFSGEALDISCGGMLVQLHSREVPNWPMDATLGVELHLPDGRHPVTLDAHFRGTRTDEKNQVSAALQFVGLEVSEAGRMNLQRLARCVQRLHRLTLEPELRSGAARLNFG
ncbi:MAG: PilZ domain-containing protein [Planctomycetes bacterium]|nr:PilZ domain-containing protein [Planctomycetota bacterium]